MKCSCGLQVACSPESYIGTQLFPGLVLTLFNCQCGSTRAAITHGSVDEFEDEPIAAE